MDKINDYLEMVDLRSTMNPKQVLLASQLIVEKHPHLPIKALDVFFKNAVCGEFGHHYNRMDIPTLMQWLQKFENDYFDMVDEQAYQAHQSTKGDKVNFRALIEEHAGEELIPMPDDIARKFGVYEDPEKDRVSSIRLKVINEYSYLYQSLPSEEATEVINALINEALKS
jgi:hypothetical protein